MKRAFPRLRAVFEPNRKNDSNYGGAVVLKSAWDYLNCKCLLLSAGISEEVWGSSQLFSIQLRFEAADGRWVYPHRAHAVMLLKMEVRGDFSVAIASNPMFFHWILLLKLFFVSSCVACKLA